MRERLNLAHDAKFTFNRFGVSAATETKFKMFYVLLGWILTNAGAAVAEMNINVCDSGMRTRPYENDNETQRIQLCDRVKETQQDSEKRE